MKILKYIGIALLICGILFAAAYFIKTNNKSVIEYETQSTIVTSIERKTVVTGKVIPEDEVEIKPQIQGIIETLFVEEGDLVNTGDLLARIKVVPNEQNLNSAQGRLANSKIVLKNSKIDFDRSKDLFSKGIISKQEFANYTFWIRRRSCFSKHKHSGNCSWNNIGNPCGGRVSSYCK
jgi:HlyD family secretion protein